ncbi:MAG: hypothetical protein KDC14_14815 [Planctomycetes bacterium]|nr:hypothetical protein [Planctomycetota bacterium]
MTLDTPPAPHPTDRTRSVGPPHQEPLSDTLPWTGVSVLLAIIGLLLFLAVPERPLSPDELEHQRLSAEVRLAYGRLRGAIEDYRTEHGRVPGTSPDGSIHTERDFRRQLLLHTDGEGHALPQALGSHPFGPYLTGDIPRNPLNGLTDVRIVNGRELSAEVDGRSGWLYDPLADELRLNAPGEWGAYRGQAPRF